MTSLHVFFFCLLVAIIMVCSFGLHTGLLNKHSNLSSGDGSDNISPEGAYLNNRKLLVHGTCTNRDISISQSKVSSSGIPQYIVQIANTCVSNCAPSKIHLHCGWFASARIVNPRTFKRLSYDDCLVNGGKPLNTSQVIRFTYSNSFMYPLTFKSANFCCATSHTC